MGIGYGIVEPALVTVDVNEVAVALCADDLVEIVVRFGVEIEIGEAERVVIGARLPINNSSAQSAQGDGGFKVASAADRFVSEMSGVGADGDPAHACGSAFSCRDG